MSQDVEKNSPPAFTQEMDVGEIRREDDGVSIRLDYNPDGDSEDGNPFAHVTLLFDVTPPDLSLNRLYRVTVTIEDIGERPTP